MYGISKPHSAERISRDEPEGARFYDVPDFWARPPSQATPSVEADPGAQMEIKEQGRSSSELPWSQDSQTRPRS